MTIEAGALALRITEIGADQVLQKLDQIDKKAQGLGKATQGVQFNAPSMTGVNGQLQAMSMNFTRVQNAASGATNALNTNTNASKQNAQASQSLTATLATQLLTYQAARSIISDVGRVIAFTTEAADNQTLAQRRLSAVSRLTGADLAFLRGVSADAQKTFHLSSASADDLTGQFAKLAQRAGHVSLTGQAMNAWLDLGAANGLTLDQTLQALTTTLGGNDEGLNKLGLMNPAQIWKKWGDAAGITVGKMTDAEKWQAIVNEVVAEGAKVNGEYVKSLETTQGAQNAFNEKLKDTAAMFGHTLDAGRSTFYGIATAAMEAALTIDKWWKGVGETMRSSITSFLEKYPFLARLARLTGDLPAAAAKNPVASLEFSPNVNAASLKAQLDAAAGVKTPAKKLTSEEKAALRERDATIAKALDIDLSGTPLRGGIPDKEFIPLTGKMAKGEKAFGIGNVVDKEFNALIAKAQEKKAQLTGILTDAGMVVGQAFGNAFTAAFEDGGNFFEAFGKSLLSGLGQIIMQLGTQMIAYAAIITPLTGILGPFAALAGGGPMTLAAGIALTALGAAMGAAGGKGGKGGAGGGSRGGQQQNTQDDTFAMQFDPDGKLRKRGSGSVATTARSISSIPTPESRPSVTVNATIIGPNDPKAQSDIALLVKNAVNRGKDIGMRKAG